MTPTPRAKEMTLAGWGNFPFEKSAVYRPERNRELREIVTAAPQPELISRGLGRSYGDAALNRDGAVVLHTRLNRFIAFDEQTGVLEAEAGVSFDDILSVFVPRGWFPPVTPGTKYVTLGGAIAADVHGKNHHRDGSIGIFVQSLKLMTAAGEIIDCSRETHPEVFRATLGGMGLTGVIVSAEIRLTPIETARVSVDYKGAANLDAALEAFGGSDQGYQYSVAWIDCLAKGSSLGRSVLVRGNHARRTELPEGEPPLAIRPGRKRKVPFNLPSWVLNSWSVKAFNAQFYFRHKDAHQLTEIDDFFYPLDRVLHWNRIYGRRGFVQYQVVFPHATARAGLVELLERLSASKRPSFLAVLKAMGPAGEGMLSFPFAGQTLSLDLPNTGPDLLEFLNGLDEVVLRHGGRVYLAKDARMSAATAARMYPGLRQFLDVKRRIDPNGRFASSLSRRLGVGRA
jgi:FAD/FMN-containing dehydrogenase